MYIHTKYDGINYMKKENSGTSDTQMQLCDQRVTCPRKLLFIRTPSVLSRRTCRNTIMYSVSIFSLPSLCHTIQLSHSRTKNLSPSISLSLPLLFVHSFPPSDTRTPHLSSCPINRALDLSCAHHGHFLYSLVLFPVLTDASFFLFFLHARRLYEYIYIRGGRLYARVAAWRVSSGE